MIPSDVKATLSFSDGSPNMELPIYRGTIGPDVIDIRKLYAQTGRHAEAEASYQEAIAVFDRFAPNHALLATTLTSYASLLRRVGRQAEAEPLEARARAIREKHRTAAVTPPAG